ncbi:hypothetical protein D3879_24905 [Pseudomonas cavernicola]|uniref:Uncharacterized protein n=2 Tax=Pseudomonas cavernicola TaxID=2320866 RepID=A0A418X9L0_9PSED|nr:hypothetical protein D3879_24905 [Pseudomonas cavernicola]
MLEENEYITHRAVVRAVEGLGAASTLTRDTYRRELVAYYQELQRQRTQWIQRARKNSQSRLLNELALKDQQIRELEQQVALLSASHKALILAVGEMGGIEAWRRFFASYDQAKDGVSKLS